MRKLIIFSVFAFILLSCGPKSDKVERIWEDGVEVIINHLKPYKIEGEPSELILEEEFRIDTEKDEVAKAGLTDIRGFDIDSHENIYILSRKVTKNFIFKFNENGSFLSSFIRKGQGPGEPQHVLRFRINYNNEIVLIDPSTHKVFFFDEDGNFIRESIVDSIILFVDSLPNGRFVTKSVPVRHSANELQETLNLCDSELSKIMTLDIYSTYFKDPRGPGKVIYEKEPMFYWVCTENKIFIGNDGRGYEIWILDFEGRILRKIRKNYKPVSFPEEIKEWKKENYKNPGYPEYVQKKKIIFPENLPPFNAFFIDERGRLVVRTYEKGSKPNEYLHDIFNPEGAFIGRKSLNIYWRGVGLYAKAKNNRLYCLREKDSGYKELVVYKMRWE